MASMKSTQPGAAMQKAGVDTTSGMARHGCAEQGKARIHEQDVTGATQ